ncbi:hypothetical protein [Absidia glauca]|uniref:Uncharacterized protein n=1 Tax=Absidia glauca TaxID=4829 RepID=A0A163KFZ6_ABSGL|nr:hypothetical protein [Absidia glauca]
MNERLNERTNERLPSPHSSTLLTFWLTMANFFFSTLDLGYDDDDDDNEDDDDDDNEDDDDDDDSPTALHHKIRLFLKF